jgi:hypothetical protein
VLVGRAIGGDALAMQVHACMTVRHLPTLISGSTAHARLNRACGPVQGRSRRRDGLGHFAALRDRATRGCAAIY